MTVAAWALVLVGAAPSGRALLLEVERLDKALGGAELRLEELGAEQTSLTREIAHLEAEQSSLQLRHQTLYTKFAARIRALARMPAGARLVLLGGSRSLADYLEAARVLRWVAAHDRQLHDQYRRENTRLVATRSLLEERRATLAALEAEARAKRDELAAARNERAALAREVLETKELGELLRRERNQAVRALADTVRRLEPIGRPQRSFAANRRRLPWPAEGKLELGYGQLVDRASGTTTIHNGFDIRAPAGSAVQAVLGGQVVYADWLAGYGRVVILDHGEQYHTVYAHLAAFACRVGEQVEQGQRVGTVGDTGSLRGTSLYFEVRHRGMPVDPADWLRR